MFHLFESSKDRNIPNSVDEAIKVLEEAKRQFREITEQPTKYPTETVKSIEQIMPTISRTLDDLKTIKKEYRKSIKLILREITATLNKSTLITLITTIIITVCVSNYQEIYGFFTENFNSETAPPNTDAILLKEMVELADKRELKKAYDRSNMIREDMLSTQDAKTFQSYQLLIEWLLAKNNPDLSAEDKRRFGDKLSFLRRSSNDSKLIFFIYVDYLATTGADYNTIISELEVRDYKKANWSIDRTFNLTQYLFEKGAIRASKEHAKYFRDDLINNMKASVLSIGDFKQLNKTKVDSVLEVIINYQKEEKPLDVKEKEARIAIYNAIDRNKPIATYAFQFMENELNERGYRNVSFPKPELPVLNYWNSQIIFTNKQFDLYADEIMKIEPHMQNSEKNLLSEVKDGKNKKVLSDVLRNESDIVIILGNAFK